jgi:hypothetical protein
LHPAPSPLAIPTSRAGNVARFINHLPDAERAKPGEATANLIKQAVFTTKDGMVDYRFYRLCLFAAQDIPVRSRKNVVSTRYLKKLCH